MEAILVVPYNYTEPEFGFDASDEIVLDASPESQARWQKSKEEFEKKAITAYKKYKPIIDRNIHRLGQNLAINNEGAKEQTNFKKQETLYAETKAFVCDMDNHRIDIDTLIDYYKSGDMFIIDLQLPLFDQDEELETEIKAWIRETIKLNNAAGLTDEERLTGYTKRDLKLKFKNSNSSAILRNTKLVDIVNNHTFAFLIEQIIFLKTQ